jgi:hypothetical protein
MPAPAASGLFRSKIPRMIHPERAMPIGVFLGLAALVATRAIDLIAQAVWTVLVVVGVGPQSDVTLAIAIYVTIGVFALGAKVVVLVKVVGAPERMAWMYRTWAAAIVLAVIEIVAAPASTLLATVQAMRVVRAEPIRVMGDWFYAQAVTTAIATWVNLALIGGMLLWAYGRTRGPSPAPGM